MASILDHFDPLPDPRRDLKKQHKLSDIMFIKPGTGATYEMLQPEVIARAAGRHCSLSPVTYHL